MLTTANLLLGIKQLATAQVRTDFEFVEPCLYQSLLVSISRQVEFSNLGNYCLNFVARWTTYKNGLKYWKPITNGQRWRVTIDRREIYPHGPFKPLTKGLRKTGGRNNTGRITCRHRGGGRKRLYRFIDFKRETENLKAEVQRIEYDPNRTGYIALVKYDQGENERTMYSYILAPQKVKPGDTIMSGDEAPLKPGNSLKLRNIPTGMRIHNIELVPGRGGQMCRSAGCYSTLLQKGEDGYGIVRLPSGEQRKLRLDCRATIGVMSNPQNKNRVIAKAGYKRLMGIRPTVRGVAMNPVDHPHGGGEGRTSGGRPSVSPWGVPCKGGYRTRKKSKWTNKFIVLSRHKLKKRRRK
eukprot:g1171.t1